MVVIFYIKNKLNLKNKEHHISNKTLDVVKNFTQKLKLTELCFNNIQLNSELTTGK